MVVVRKACNCFEEAKAKICDIDNELPWCLMKKGSLVDFRKSSVKAKILIVKINNRVL